MATEKLDLLRDPMSMGVQIDAASRAGQAITHSPLLPVPAHNGLARAAAQGRG
jgi:hypothetical protein